MRLIVRGWLAATGLAGLVAARAHAQEPVTMSGKVTSDAGLPLGQVEVALPTLGLGALSRDDGAYTLVVPSLYSPPFATARFPSGTAWDPADQHWSCPNRAKWLLPTAPRREILSSPGARWQNKAA